MFSIPVADLNDQVIDVILSGNSFSLRLTWNDTCQIWTAGLFDSSQTPIVQGYAVNPNRPLFKPIVSASLPPGYIIPVRLDRQNTISRTDFVNNVVTLVYIEYAEVSS